MASVEEAAAALASRGQRSGSKGGEGCASHIIFPGRGSSAAQQRPGRGGMCEPHYIPISSVTHIKIYYTLPVSK